MSSLEPTKLFRELKGNTLDTARKPIGMHVSRGAAKRSAGVQIVSAPEGKLIGHGMWGTCEEADPAGEQEAGGDVGGVAQLPQQRAPEQPPELRPPAAPPAQGLSALREGRKA